MLDNFTVGYMKNGVFIQDFYHKTNNRYFKTVINGGIYGKAKRISKKEYIDTLYEIYTAK